MRLDLVSNTETFVGVRVTLTVGELQRLMNQLESLKSSADQHFHLTTDGDGVFLDVEVGVQGSGERSNAAMTGFAIEPNGT